MLIAVPPVAVIVVCLVLAYQIYAGNRVMAEHRRFPILKSPVPPQKLLIFSPHCDDETLGAGGLIQDARKHGCEVHVVFFTNGDGFRIGISQEFAKLSVGPADFVRYGYLRQSETHTALAVLGVPDSDITFLGYPDRGLMPMLTDYWNPSHLYRSPYSQADHTPYRDSATPNAPYCGASVLKDVENQMERIQPTDVFVTHPNDDHPDHAAASVFVRSALEELRARGEEWAQRARLHYYLVHRGDWPVPQGLHENASLPPPSQLANLDTQWEQFPLTRHELQRKYAAIKRYKSQTMLTGRFLYSFVRRNELFGTVDREVGRSITVLPETHPALTANQNSWMGIKPVALDPAGDNVMRMIQSGADITRLFAARRGSQFLVRVDMAGTIVKGAEYRISIRPLLIGSEQSQPKTTDLSFVAADPDLVTPVVEGPPATVRWHERTILFQLPWNALGIPEAATGDIYLQADTRVAGMAFDRTGFRAVPFRASAPLIASNPH